MGGPREIEALSNFSAYRPTLLYNCEMSSANNQNSRIQVLDALRGFALAGILIINANSILAVKGSTPAFSISIPGVERALQDLILFFMELDLQFRCRALTVKGANFYLV